MPYRPKLIDAITTSGPTLSDLTAPWRVECGELLLACEETRSEALRQAVLRLEELVADIKAAPRSCDECWRRTVGADGVCTFCGLRAG